MDAEILHNRIATLEEAILKMDQRLDSLGPSPDGDPVAREAATECQRQLSEMNAQLISVSEQMGALTMAAVVTAAETQQAQEEAQEAQQTAETALEMAVESESEAGPEEAVIEVEPAPAPTPEEQTPNRSPSFWERALGGK